ncbi:MAG: response regulator [Candidatus Obscuribacterales bacterium]|nr:response regulator [Candidatus Obscuribacterales bacterium]
MSRHIEVLMIEDSPTDVMFAREAFSAAKLLNNVSVVEDGVSAMSYLRKESGYSAATTPDLIFLDLNLPGKHGSEILRDIKADAQLKHIPIVILTTSDDEQDILNSYRDSAACFITKPVDMQKFIAVARDIAQFWFAVVTLPENAK